MNFGTFLLNFTKVSTHNVLSSTFSVSDVNLVRALVANKNLVVTQPYKGNGVIILDTRHILVA